MPGLSTPMLDMMAAHRRQARGNGFMRA